MISGVHIESTRKVGIQIIKKPAEDWKRKRKYENNVDAWIQCLCIFNVICFSVCWSLDCAITCCYTEPCVSVVMQYLVDSLKLFLSKRYSLNFQCPRIKFPIFKGLF